LADGREDHPGQVGDTAFSTFSGTNERINRIYPEWKVDADFINTHLTAALRLDAKLSSHAIEVAVPDAGQIGQIFDSLSYSKAASGASVRVGQLEKTTDGRPIVLRMLSKFVGEEKFLKGVSLYLKKHLYSNTVSRDLWEGIGEATGTHVRICAVSMANEGYTKDLTFPGSWIAGFPRYGAVPSGLCYGPP
jgi:aminopeptidase 2